MISGEKISKLFDKLNQCGVEYLLIRNINEELPHKLQQGKDIDVLVKYNKLNQLEKFFLKNKFQEKRHPHRENVFLYGVNKFKFYENSDGILIDAHFQLVCRSLDEGQWIPLDQMIQKSAWLNRRYEERDGLAYWTLGYEDEFITLVARSIFDKKIFQDGYKKRIILLLELINEDEVRQKMNCIFFKYTNQLLQQIKNKDFDNIIANYLKYKEY